MMKDKTAQVLLSRHLNIDGYQSSIEQRRNILLYLYIILLA